MRKQLFLILALFLSLNTAFAQSLDTTQTLTFDDGQTDSITVSQIDRNWLSITTFNFLGLQYENGDFSSPFLFELNQQWQWKKNGLEVSFLASPWEMTDFHIPIDDIYWETEAIYKHQLGTKNYFQNKPFRLSDKGLNQFETTKFYKGKMPSPIERNTYLRLGMHYFQSTTQTNTISASTTGIEQLNIPQKHSSLFFGFSLQTTQSLLYQAKHLRKKSSFRRNTLYADIFISPLASSLGDTYDKSIFGLRIGGSNRMSWSTARIASTLSYEVSIFPGYDRNNIIVSLGYGISLISRPRSIQRKI